MKTEYQKKWFMESLSLAPVLQEDHIFNTRGILTRDMKASDINPTCWEAVAIDRSSGRHVDKSGTQIRRKKK